MQHPPLRRGVLAEAGTRLGAKKYVMYLYFDGRGVHGQKDSDIVLSEPVEGQRSNSRSLESILRTPYNLARRLRGESRLHTPASHLAEAGRGWRSGEAKAVKLQFGLRGLLHYPKGRVKVEDHGVHGCFYFPYPAAWI